MNPILIIGGGFAGLSAAVDLAERNLPVVVLERRNFLGGRAYSFTDKTTGDVVDNGQHLMMGCYHHTLAFLDKIGARDKLKFQANPRVDFLHEHEGHARFQCPALPAPLHLLGGLARLSSLNWRDRIHALRVGFALRTMNGVIKSNRAHLADKTARQWLNELGQTERMQNRFWDLVALATLNESPERASADMFARVLEQAFMHTKQDSTMVISRTGLSELYTTDAQTFVEKHGSKVRLNASVKSIDFADGEATGVTLEDGETIAASAIISAAPYFMLKRILPAELVHQHAAWQHISEFQSSPIVSINLWYDRQVTDLEFVGLLDSPIEWVFNKNAIADDHARTPQHLALVISGAHEAAKQNKEELLAVAQREMRRFFPAARSAALTHSFIIREHDATLSHTVGTARLRPSQQTPYPNFFFAGDWTATGLPATIEGAVWSGQECARRLTATADER